MKYQQRSTPADKAPDEFVLSDASVDRMGDVIEQDGWKLDNFRKVPIALFNHDRNQVIGKWADVAVRDGQLTGRLELAEPGTSPLVDSIRALVKQKILRAVSVGFRPMKSEPLTKEADKNFGPFRFKQTELLECSLVSIPANPNALAVARELPRDLVSEIFCKPANENPARHGKPAETLPKKGDKMQTPLGARITAAQNEYNAAREHLKELAGKDELTPEETAQYDELPGKIEKAKAELDKHQRAERALIDGDGGGQKPINVPTADITPPERPRVFAAPRKKEEPDLVLRALACMAKSQAAREPDLGKALRELYHGDEMTNVVLRAAVNPANTTVATWAAELISTVNVGFLDRLIPNSIYQQLAPMGARYTFGNAGVLKIPVRANTPTLAGNWVGEGAAKPVRRASFSTVSLTPTKLAVISTFTEEMATYGSPAIEGIIRQAMADDTSIALDSYLIDNVAGSATRPAGLLNAAAWGTGTLTPSAATPATAAMVADLKAIVAAFTAINGGRKIAILLNPAQALALGFAQTTTGDFLFTDRAQAGSKFGVSFIVSNTVPAARVIGVDAEDFASATGDTPRFAVSTDATLHEEDTVPLPLSATGSPNTVAAPMRSLFQTDAVAIRMSLYVSWAMRRAGMVQTMSPVIW